MDYRRECYWYKSRNEGSEVEYVELMKEEVQSQRGGAVLIVEMRTFQSSKRLYAKRLQE